MSAGTQLQMAPQTTIIQGGQTSIHNQDSNMSTGSSHSDKELETGNTPDKIARTPSERKRKRKAPTDDSGGHVSSGRDGNVGTVLLPQNPKGPRVNIPNLQDSKKINEYFLSKQTGNSPIRQLSTGGAKSPSPQQSYPMFPPSPQPPLTVTNLSGSEFFKNRASSNIVHNPIPPPPPPTPNPATVALQQSQQQPAHPQNSTLAMITSSTTVSLNSTPTTASSPMVSKSTQTELSYTDIQERDSEYESSKLKLDELTRLSDEQKCQITAHQKVIEQHKSHINKCIDVVKKLLKEKSNIEKKEARQKCMQNRLRLGQFVTQRVGATFQENWTDGYAFQELARRQEEIAAEREEIDRQKKLLMKKRPSNSEHSRKRNTSSSSTTSTTSTSTTLGPALHNGDSGGFLKPESVAGGFTQQEYYESDEILKLRQNALKKEDADLQLEMEKLERERNLHIRELKRIHNEDQVRKNQVNNKYHYTVLILIVIIKFFLQSRFNNHPVLNDRYLLLMLLGKGGFSEVHKAFDLKEQRYVACKVHQLNKDWKEDKKANYIKYNSNFLNILK